MLERIREGSRGPWAMIIIGLVVLSFIFAGVGSYLNSSAQTVAATVNGEDISLNELERAYQNQRSRMESQYGESVSAMFSDEGYMKQFRRSVLESLIGDTLVSQKAKELGLRISDEQIRDTIRNMQEFQLGGQFNNERYLSLLRQNGFQPSDFRDYLRVQLTREQLARALGVSGFALPYEAEGVYELQAQTRNGEYLMIGSAPFGEQIEITDEDIQNYYDANITRFDTEEEVNVAYVTLSVDDLKDNVSVSDDDIDKWYEENQGQYISEEERRVSHILIEAGDDDAAAKEKAEALLSKIKQGADFAELAEANSDDTFSAKNGGDLEFISQGMMDAPFDEAAFALKKVGDVSDVVKTDYGYHIIKLTDIKPEEVQSLDAVRDEIRETLITEKATDEFYDLQGRMAEVAFERPESLEEVAAVANQPIEETGLFTRNNAPEVMSNPQALNDAFSDELVENRVNSDVIEREDGSVMVLRVKEHEPQRTQSLDEVRESIVANLQTDKAQQAAIDFAESLVSKLENGESIETELAEHDLSWQSANEIPRQGSELPVNLVDTLFRLGLAEGENTQVARLNTGDAAVVKLFKVNQPEPADDNIINSIEQRLSQAYSQSLYESYVKSLRESADVEINATR